MWGATFGDAGGRNHNHGQKQRVCSGRCARSMSSVSLRRHFMHTYITFTQGRYVHLFFVSVILVRGLWWVLFHRSCCVIAVHLFTTLHSRSCAERISCLPPVYCWIATDVQGVVSHQSCHISGVGNVVRCTTLSVSRLRHDATRRGAGEPKASLQWQWVLKCWHGQLAWVLLANSTARRSGSAHWIRTARRSMFCY